MSELLETKDVAERLGRSRRSVLLYAEQGLLKATTRYNRSFYSEEDVEKLEEMLQNSKRLPKNYHKPAKQASNGKRVDTRN